MYSNSLNATTSSSLQNNSSSQQQQQRNSNYMHTKTTKNKPHLTSQSDDFEFLRPKDPPMPTKLNLLTSSTSRLEQKIKYNQHAYSNSNSLSCSSNGGSMSSLSSASPTPSFNNSNNALSMSNLNQTNKPLAKSNNAYENSKSILFGIPREHVPMPVEPSMNADNFHPVSMDSPFVDVTLNNCDDLSLYQPMLNKPKSKSTPIGVSNVMPSTTPNTLAFNLANNHSSYSSSNTIDLKEAYNQQR